MDSKRRRSKQQEKKSSPSYIRRKRSSAKTTKKRKPAPTPEPKIMSTINRGAKSTKKIIKKRRIPVSKSRTVQNLELSVKDGWIKLLI